MKWNLKRFLIATPEGVQEVEGYVYKGLGVTLSLGPAGMHAPLWKVTHLGSGHPLAHLKAQRDRAVEIATELAECSDWDFMGLYGWKNRDPHVISKVAAIKERNPGAFHDLKNVKPRSEDQAREIMMRNSDMPLT